MYTPLVYSGDTAYVATCQKFTGFGTENILDITDKLNTPSAVDDETKKIFEKAIGRE